MLVGVAGAQKPGADAAAMDENAAAPPQTILIADDDALLCRAIERVLEPKGYKVLAAIDGALAVELSRSYAAPIHLALADIMMPVQHGLSLVDTLVCERPETKIVLTSGAIREHMLLASERERVHAFLPKPFTPSHLLQLVRHLLQIG